METVSPTDALNSVVHDVGDVYRLRVTDFFGSSREYAGRPQASLNEFWRVDPTRDAEELVPSHFHHVRQFLVFTDTGHPTLEGHEAVPQFSFQFTDPSTPYGPVMVGSDHMAFFAMRSKPDVAGYLPAKHRDKMRGAPGRKIVVRAPAESEANGNVEPLLNGHDDGLASFRIVLAPGQGVTGPDPSHGDGQFYVVTHGSIDHERRRCGPLTLGWVSCDDPAPTITGGPEGGAVLIVQFPLPDESEITEAEMAGR